MCRNERGRSVCVLGRAVTTLALVLGVVACSGYAASPGAPKKDEDEEFTRIYRHTYDEVFQAAQETIERKGLFVRGEDKDKGTITGDGKLGPCKVILDVHVESVSTKPETRVTVNATLKGFTCGRTTNAFRRNFLAELQKVLVTYR